MKNFQEHPQSIILTDSIGPVLERLHQDGQYALGQDCGIYWRETNPPEKGAEAPDWFYLPNVPPMLNGQTYWLWQKFPAPHIVLEFASGDGSEERNTTPLSYSEAGEVIKPGKFWLYERIMSIPFYGIYLVSSGNLEVYNLVNGQYQQLAPNERGHYAIVTLDVELGLWQGSYQNQTMLWLRWWDSDGNLLLTGAERAFRAEQAQRNAIPRLLAMGLNIEQVAQALSLSVDEVRHFSQQ